MTKIEPKCPLCGAWNPPGHRCPRERACVDCGQPADMFDPDPDALALDDAAMIQQAGADPESDKALCDGCFYLRARRQQRRRSN